jgi:hypothetical protein
MAKKKKNNSKKLRPAAKIKKVLPLHVVAM